MDGVDQLDESRCGWCINCHQAGNIQHLPRSHIDQMDHTLLQTIAVLILINISFYLPVKSETSPYPSRKKEEKPGMLITCQCLWFLLSICGNKGVLFTSNTCRLGLFHYKKKNKVLLRSHKLREYEKMSMAINLEMGYNGEELQINADESTPETSHIKQCTDTVNQLD